MNKSVGAGWVVCWWYQLSSSFWGIVDVGLEGKKKLPKRKKKRKYKSKNTHTYIHTKQLQYKQIHKHNDTHTAAKNWIIGLSLSFPISPDMAGYKIWAIFVFFSICPQKLISKNNLCQLHFLFKSVVHSSFVGKFVVYKNMFFHYFFPPFKDV